MANGDLGSLWFNLGIKDTTGVTLNRIQRQYTMPKVLSVS